MGVDRQILSFNPNMAHYILGAKASKDLTNGTGSYRAMTDASVEAATAAIAAVAGLSYLSLPRRERKPPYCCCTTRPGLVASGIDWPVRATRIFALAPDLRGHGDTDKPASGYATEDHAADIEDLIQQLGLD